MERKIFTVFVLSFCGILSADDSVQIYVTYGQRPTEIAQFITAEDMRGASIAAEEINENGGVFGRKLTLIDGVGSDSGSLVEKTMALIEKDEITAVVGGNSSNLSKMLGPLFQEAGIPMVSPIASHPDVTAIGDYIFRMCFTDPMQGTLMAVFAREELAAKRAVILKTADSTYSVSLAEFFSKEFSKNGSIIWTGSFLGDDCDFEDLLEKVKTLKPDVVVPGLGQDTGRILRQARSMEIDTVFLGGDGWGKGTLGIAGADAAEGNYYINHWHKDAAGSENEDFVLRYQKKYGEDKIAASAALAYDAVYLIADAIDRAGSLDRARIRDELARTKGFEGITGTITFDAQGDPIGRQGVILCYRNGEIRFVKTVSP